MISMIWILLFLEGFFHEWFVVFLGLFCLVMFVLIVFALLKGFEGIIFFLLFKLEETPSLLQSVSIHGKGS